MISRIKSKTLLIACMAAMGALAPSAQATSLTTLTVEQMTDASDLVVRAEVTQVWVEQDERGNLRTRAQLEVSSVIKGKASVDSVLVDQIGGVLHNDFSVVPFAVRFSPGEDGIFFLEHQGGMRTTVVGWSQGKYTIRSHPETGEEMVVRTSIPQDRHYEHRFLPHPPEHQQVMLDALVQRVQERLVNGWDGRPIPGVSSEKLMRINKLQPTVSPIELGVEE